MDKRLAWAVENNAGWCDLVCRAHGVSTEWTPGLWVASRRPPELYPDTEEQLREWARLTGAPHAFRPRLLRDPGVRILAVRTDDGFGAGLVANLTGPVVGISNVFATTTPADEAWLDIPRVAASLFPGSPLVGYEHGPRLDAAIAAGFAPVGELRVWLRASALTG